MMRGWARLLVVMPLCLGCDTLGVRTFAGTVVQMSFVGSTPTADGHHLELWTRDQYNDIIRVDAKFIYEDKAKNTQTLVTRGLQIRQALPLNDPCLIDGKGNLLTTAAAYTSTTSVNNVKQTPDQQAQQVVNRIKQTLSMGDGGIEPVTLYVVVPYDPTPVPTIPMDAAPADRLAMCHSLYWDVSPLTYTGNPAQPTAPMHGAAYGFVAFTTQSPAQGYDGIRLDSPTSLKGTQEIWLTDETASVDMVDPNNRGPIYLQSTPTPGGREVLHFDLTGPTASGTAALEVNLDDDTVLF